MFWCGLGIGGRLAWVGDSLVKYVIDHNQFKSVRKAVQVFKVPRTTVRRRRAGIAARRDCEPNSKKLSKLEEEVITEYILNLDSRGFSPSLGAVRDMANRLLAERDAGQVGRDWPKNCVRRPSTVSVTRTRTTLMRRAS